MANKIFTVFQNLDKAISGNWDMSGTVEKSSDLLSPSAEGSVLYKTQDKTDYMKTKLELQQNKYLSNRWQKANVDLSVQAFTGLNNVKLMYRDADLMDSFPEIGAALDIMMEESTVTDGGTNQVVHVYSQSDRIKSVLEELFTNRLDIQITAPMIIRGMCKYGNHFMLLNIDRKLGITGWRQLPVFNVERLENGVENQFGIGVSKTADGNPDLSTKFVWNDERSTQVAFRNWQIGHFRLLNNSMYLPYGVSALNAARRHWRMLSLMEDMMLIYRLERSIERRVYKIYVGAIDDADVKTYVEEIANNFKRTPIIDPMTGQVDLRKNILPVHKNTPIPLMDGRTITIEELAKEFQEGKENYVYSIQDKTGTLVKGKVIWCGKNYTAEKLVRINLGDSTHCLMAAEHEVILEGGKKKRADELVSGDSIIPYDAFGKEDLGERIIWGIIVNSTEVVDGDDVYCMTVVGENGEEDRHNFAIRSFEEDGSWSQRGIFVSNCVDQDIFIPVRSENAPNPIDTLAPAQNLTAMDDIKFVQNKVLAALRIPRTFLNFEETTGDGKNLALMDVRFTRTVNRIQQAFLMELTKIACIHLYMLGFTDELTNFQLSMNNPSTQAEQLQIDNTAKKIQAVRDAVTDPGGGIPIMSLSRALKEIMKWSDKDIQNNLEEIRLERAIAAELEKTSQIIKKTGIFDTVDRIYGEPGAEYQEDQGAPTDQEGGMGGGGGGGGLGGFGDESMPPSLEGGEEGDDVDNLGNVGADENGDISGEESEIPISGSEPQDNSQNESKKRKREKLITEGHSKRGRKKRQTVESKNMPIDKFFLERFKRQDESVFERANVCDKALLINEEIDSMIKSIDVIKD
jgi:hypothetical protein